VGGEVDTRAVAALVDGGLVDLARDRPGGDPHGDGQRYTAPTRQGGGAEFAKMRVDYIFGTRPVAALATGCRVVGGDTADRASDHYPVVAEFDLNL
jgi:endonuclease/exonuclease/phosphatase family metal-dependent hydrolase